MIRNQFERLIGFSLRIISKNKFYSWIIVFTFAVGIGACTVAYSLFDSILQSPLPFKDSDRLVLIKSTKNESEGNISLSDIQLIQERISLFDGVAAYWPDVQYNLSGDEGKLAEEVPTTLCTSNLFDVLGIQMTLGQIWPQEYDQTVSFGTVISHSLWERRYNKDPSIVGAGMTLDTNPQYGVFGVLPKGFKFPFEGEIFRSMIIGESQLTNRAYRNVVGVARLAETVSLEDAKAALNSLSIAAAGEFPANEDLSYEIAPIKEMYLDKVSPYLKMIALAVACVFMLVCVNVGSLLLSIAHQRRKEIAIRRLVGGSFSTVVLQYLTQNMMLAILGGGLGVLLSFWSLTLIESSIMNELPFWVSITLNNEALGLAVLLTVAAGLLTAIIPAIKSAGINSRYLISPSLSALGFNQKLKDILVGVQLALGTCLIIVASAIIRDLVKLQNASLGFDKEKVEVFEVAVPFDKYKYDFDAVNAFYTRALKAFEEMPGVEAVAVNDNLPLVKEESILPKTTISLESQSPEDQLLNPKVNQQKVTPSYHTAMGIQLQSGRTFNVEDQKSSLAVCIISKDLANRLWPNESPLGQRLKTGATDSNSALMTVVGVSENVKHSDIASQSSYDLYIPLIQSVAFDSYFVVKTANGYSNIESQVSDVMAVVEPDQSVFGFTTMDQVVSKKLWKQRLSGSIFSAFGAIAFFIALIGIYSVVNHSVTTQMKQLSIRRVLGASNSQVALIMVKKIFLLAILGAGVGLLLTFSLRDFLSQIILDLSMKEQMLSLVYVAVFVLVSLLASVIPVNKVLRLNPAKILRSE